MSIFGKIKDAIFGKKADAPTTGTPGENNAWANAPVVDKQAVPVVDVENNLDSMPGADNLNWRTSIVDLMKLLNIDSDYEARKALANELGRDNYSGSAEDNVWLHQRVMRELASNGGKVPAQFLD
ncbi:DUF3597 domain-containing protein [Qipengyuania marisflavi]|uniref:DUF3597 domain-containing protein n=1 Tax=Qipengyuania marisflavi TaxID=2486356 RepID=A0A5S3PCA0_9SPHN|nr:DUF3597 domain-containing protein [Qipengyuania marisflavi]TMM48869.1 DUF3597 domain-containing protein [Qipengyuania marisflavi]